MSTAYNSPPPPPRQKPRIVKEGKQPIPQFPSDREENNENPVFKILAIIAIWMVCYLAMSFINLELNPFNWEWISRMIFIVISISLSYNYIIFQNEEY